MNFLFILYGGILGVLIGQVWTLRSELREIQKHYDDELESKLRIFDE